MLHCDRPKAVIQSLNAECASRDHLAEELRLVQHALSGVDWDVSRGPIELRSLAKQDARCGGLNSSGISQRPRLRSRPNRGNVARLELLDLQRYHPHRPVSCSSSARCSWICIGFSGVATWFEAMSQGQAGEINHVDE